MPAPLAEVTLQNHKTWQNKDQVTRIAKWHHKLMAVFGAANSWLDH